MSSCARSVPDHWEKTPKVERFFTAELAIYLNVSKTKLQRLARERRIDRYAVISLNPQRKSQLMWVDRKGAAWLIGHFRAMQGEMLAEGRDWDEERAKRLRRKR
jgi:hypothetical protein